MLRPPPKTDGPQPPPPQTTPARSPPPQLKAAQLSSFARNPPAATPHIDHRAELLHRASLLQEQVLTASLSISAPVTFAISCAAPRTALTPTHPSAPRAAIIAAEIFRHALHIHVHRIAHGPAAPLDGAARRALDEALALLLHVHDASGPLSNLGWALVVLGAEVHACEARHFLRAKWRALHLLELNNSRASERVVLDFWARRDACVRGEGGEVESWQDMVRRAGEELVPLV